MNLEQTARILVDAMYSSDVTAAKKWGVTLRTVYRYRNRFRTDPQLSAIVTKLRQEFESNWKPELARAITTGVKKMARMIEAAPEGKTFNAAALEAVTGAVKVLSEIQITSDVLNAGQGGLKQDFDTKESYAFA